MEEPESIVSNNKRKVELGSPATWDRLLNGLAEFRSAVETAEELFRSDAQVRALLTSRIPLLGAPGAFGIVRGAILDLTITVKRLQAGSRPR